MTALSDTKPALWLRIVQFPATRLIVLGGVLFMMMAKSNELMAIFAKAPLKAIAAAAAMSALAFVVYVAFVRLVERRPVSELAPSRLGRDLGTGLLIGGGLYTACVLILMVLGIYRIEGMNPLSFMLPAVSMALSSAIFEELVFRGVLFRVVEEWVGSWISLAVSSVVFGFLHLINPTATLMGAIFISIEAGLLLAAAYMLTRRLWMSMGFHFSWNYTQSGIFSGIVSGGDADPGLFKSVIQGPLVLTGGNFGLESSLIAFLLCTSTGVVLLIMAVRRGHVVSPFWRQGS